MHKTEHSQKYARKGKPYLPNRQEFHTFLETRQIVESLYEGNSEISPTAQSNLNWSVGKKANFDVTNDFSLKLGIKHFLNRNCNILNSDRLND